MYVAGLSFLDFQTTTYNVSSGSTTLLTPHDSRLSCSNTDVGIIPYDYDENADSDLYDDIFEGK